MSLEYHWPRIKFYFYFYFLASKWFKNAHSRVRFTDAQACVRLVWNFVGTISFELANCIAKLLGFLTYSRWWLINFSSNITTLPGRTWQKPRTHTEIKDRMRHKRFNLALLTALLVVVVWRGWLPLFGASASPWLKKFDFREPYLSCNFYIS